MSLDVYRSSPKDWGRWGDGDRIGRANLLDDDHVLAAATACIRTGKRFSLARPIRNDEDKPPVITLAETAPPEAGGVQFVEDGIALHCHSTTHMDALGHSYADAIAYNGTPVGETPHADVAALARRGVVGRAVLVDIARWAGVDVLPAGYRIDIDDVTATLRSQSTDARHGDILLLRTGIETQPNLDAEPGLCYSPALVDWLNAHDIVAVGSDTCSNELAFDPGLGASYPLHVLLQRNLGISFHEALSLDEWATDCHDDHRYDAFYVAAPLRLEGGTGAPMNPLVIK